jgi:hypothetical protein
MAAPTLTDYQQSNWTDNVNTSEVTASATWSAGSVVVVVGITEDDSNTLATPTWSDSATFSALSGTPTSAGSSCKGYAWVATANGAGSGVITSTVDANFRRRGIAVFVYSGSDGIGNVSVSAALGATTTQSLVRAHANSAVISVWGDWAAVNDTTVSWTPASFTQRVAEFVTAASFFLGDWGDQGAAGTTSYGFTGHAGGGDFTAITIEVRGAAAAGSSSVSPSVSPSASVSPSESPSASVGQGGRVGLHARPCGELDGRPGRCGNSRRD